MHHVWSHVLDKWVDDDAGLREWLQLWSHHDSKVIIGVYGGGDDCNENEADDN